MGTADDATFGKIAILDRWQVCKKIGSGSFGEVFLGIDNTDDSRVAIKTESARKRNPHLLYEAKLITQLAGGTGIPRIHYYGTQNETHVMVMELLGPSLEDLFDQCNRRFSMKTTLMLIDMMIGRIEFVHSRFIIHRDIKPHNFLIGVKKTEKLVYVIDFGLAKKYRDPRTLDHIPFREGKNLTGTARYVSISTHIGIEQARRDDLESLAYVFIYFVKGQLPWQGLKATSKKEKYDKIKECKIRTDIDVLCRDLPREFREFLLYCRLLKFAERPDYSYCRKLFCDLYVMQNYSMDWQFDWAVASPKSAKSRR